MKKYLLAFIFIFSFTVPSFSQASAGFSWLENQRQGNNPQAVYQEWETVVTDVTPSPTKFDAFGTNINNSFYFVLDIIVNMRDSFMDFAWRLARIVFLVAICLAALNYAITGQGLKENIVKIMKAVVFFMIVLFGYPAIIGWLTSITFSMAYSAVGSDVETYFKGNTTELVSRVTNREFVDKTTTTSNFGMNSKTVFHVNTLSELVEQETDIKRDPNNLFGSLVKYHDNYTVMQPATLIKIVFLVADECFKYSSAQQSNQGWYSIGQSIGNTLLGLIMAFFVILTGAFAVLEYVVCFLEFMFVTSVGIILFPFSIWEGSKFAAESFIKAILGFTLKLLFINIAIFLMAYGYISILNHINAQHKLNKVMVFDTGIVIFVIFSCLLFFFICKSAPGMAQSLLTGSPSLSATGAISAVTGAVGAAMAVGGMAKGAVNNVASGGASVGGAVTSAISAGQAAKDSGGSFKGGVMASLGVSAGNQLMRSLTGNKHQSMEDVHNHAKDLGRHRGAGYNKTPSMPNPQANFSRNNAK